MRIETSFVTMNFNNMIKKITLVVVLLFSVLAVDAQSKGKSKSKPKEEKSSLSGLGASKKSKQLPSIALGVGILSFNGDIGNGVNLTSFGRVRTGYNVAIEQRVGKVIGFTANGLFGKLADSESSAKRNLNFESKITQIDVNLILHLFDNDLVFKRTSVFAPYLGVGVGLLKFNSYADLKDKNGIKYNYWADGTIRDMPDSTVGAHVLHRDYTYETKLNDSAKYTNSSLSIPLTFGVNLKLVDNLYVNMGATYYMTMTDWIDNFKSGSNDSYIYAKVGLQYNFGKPYDDSDPVYSTVDFSSLDQLDSDGDGIKDGEDMCPGTPKDVKVTETGCPQDNDQDGVPDHLDKEPLTKAGALVDEKGVTLTEKMLSDRQKEFNALATERSSLFNENPSLGYLKDVEKQFKNKGTKNPSSVPVSLRSADLDKDGTISTAEIAKAIDSFFEGDSDFTVEKLNDLIDFFFEQ
jgi:hypothetical protein